jgi:hypothetical protein
MSSTSEVKLRKDRSGIIFKGQELDGFPFFDDMGADDQLKVARWAHRLTPDVETEEQKALLKGYERPKPSAARREAMRQDEILSSAPVRALWRQLDEDARKAVVNPENYVGKQYPLSTGKLAELTGLTSRRVRNWSDLGLLPHWSGANGYRAFDSPAAIVAFTLRDQPQADRQFFTDLGASATPLEAAAQAISLISLRMLEIAGERGANAAMSAERILRSAADDLRDSAIDHAPISMPAITPEWAKGEEPVPPKRSSPVKGR